MIYYNEIDPYCCAWLKSLIAAGVLPQGVVDERDIHDIEPRELAAYSQCHFFAGLGGWAYALQLAEWDGPVWTGSCPCQPFSTAGQGRGFADERHLWPAWFHLIEECRPPIVFGEQVASKDGLAWFDLVSTDLEGAGYAVGAADLCAAGIGAPHIRQRLWFVADADLVRGGRDGGTILGAEAESGSGRSVNGNYLDESQLNGVVGHAHDAGSQGRHVGRNGGDERAVGATGVGGVVADAASGIARHGYVQRSGEQRLQSEGGWSDLEWLPCRDGKARPTQPGIFPLVAGLPARIQQLRAAGNAIVPQVAEEFIRAYRGY